MEEVLLMPELPNQNHRNKKRKDINQNKERK
jgi:hypothetical protein